MSEDVEAGGGTDEGGGAGYEERGFDGVASVEVSN